MRKFLEWIKQEESGQGMVEYGIILGVVVALAVILFAKDTGISGTVKSIFDKIKTDLASIAPAAG